MIVQLLYTPHLILILRLIQVIDTGSLGMHRGLPVAPDMLGVHAVYVGISGIGEIIPTRTVSLQLEVCVTLSLSIFLGAV